MPIDAPLYTPDPKSACTGLVVPMIITQAEELAEMGSWSTGVFQMLSAGSTGHIPILGDCADATQKPDNTIEITRPVTGRERSMYVPRSSYIVLVLPICP